MAKKAQKIEAKATEVKAPETVKVEAAQVETAPKKTTRKAAPRAAKVKTTISLQFHGSELTEADLVEKAKQLWAEAGKAEAVKELNLYVKPEDNAVYCVINGETMGSFEI